MRTSPSVGLPVLVLSVLATGGTCVEDAVASKAAAHGGAFEPSTRGAVNASSTNMIRYSRWKATDLQTRILEYRNLVVRPI